MSLLLIVQKVWRYKLLTLPIVAFVLVGALYVLAIKPPVYEASSTYILVNPPAPPSESAIARDPKLGQVDADNPYTRYSDQSVVVQVLAGRLSSDEARQALAAQGADPTYTLAPSPEFGYSAPIVQITGTGSSPAGAVKTANIVGRAVRRELNRMQEVQHVAPRYRIVTQQVVAPHRATLKASGKLRALVAVLALGTILLFLAVSIADAVMALRGQRREERGELGLGVGGGAEATLEPLLPLGRDPHDGPDTTDVSAAPRRGTQRRTRAATR